MTHVKALKALLQTEHIKHKYYLYHKDRSNLVKKRNVYFDTMHILEHMVYFKNYLLQGQPPLFACGLLNIAWHLGHCT